MQPRRPSRREDVLSVVPRRVLRVVVGHRRCADVLVRIPDRHGQVVLRYLVPRIVRNLDIGVGLRSLAARVVRKGVLSAIARRVPRIVRHRRCADVLVRIPGRGGRIVLRQIVVREDGVQIDRRGFVARAIGPHRRGVLLHGVLRIVGD